MGMALTIPSAAGATADGVASETPAATPQVRNLTITVGMEISVAWATRGVPAGSAARVVVQLAGYQPVEVSTTRRSIAVDWGSLWLNPVPADAMVRFAKATVTLVDSAGRPLASRTGIRQISRLAAPQAVSVTPEVLGYSVAWQTNAFDRSTVALVVEVDPETGGKAVVRTGLASKGRIFVPTSRLDTRFVQVFFVGGPSTSAAASALAPESPLQVTPIDPGATDVTPPAPPCCLTWAGGASSLTVAWNASDYPGAQGLLLWVGESLDNRSVSRVTMGPGAGTFTIPDLQPKARYFVSAAAFDAANNVSAQTPTQEIYTQ